MASLPTTLPILLLPFRLETRFIDTTNGPQLWVRIYSDQFAIDTHEPELTDTEQAAGKAYWNTLWQAGTTANDQEKIAWRKLATTFGPQRAAWIARSLTPTNLDKRPNALTPANTRPQPVPTFPTVSSRPSSWNRAPQAVGLPDSITVVTYVQGKETHRVTATPVRTPLPIGITPQPSLPQDPTALQVDEQVRWMVDFDEAVAAGMALRIQISQQERAGGFDRVVAFGIKSPTQDMSGTTFFSSLLDAHHYTDGLALVPQGSPTNNTPDASSAFSRQDPGYETSFAVERQEPLAQTARCDGQVLAQTLGIAPTFFDHVQYANGHDQQDAYYMGLALWPGTLGYFLRQMMANIFTNEQVSQARSYFLSYVRPRGPLPALRMGNTPYGVLPVTSLTRWNQANATAEEQAWISILRQMSAIWLSSSATTPRVGGTGDLDADMVGILGMDASSTAFRGRYALGSFFIWNTMNLLTMAQSEQMAWFQNYTNSGRRFLDLLGLNAWDPLVIHLGVQQSSFHVPYPTVQDGPLSETERLKSDWKRADGTDANYIHWLTEARIEDIRSENYPTPTAKPTSVLYRLLRQSVLLEYSNLAMDALVGVGALTLAATKEPELVNIAASSHTVTPWEALSRPVQGITQPGQSIGQYLEALPPTTQGGPFGTLNELRNSLTALASLPTAELDRLLTETLDTCSHRLDAWITSLATLLLSQQRQGQTSGPGLYLGGFGWVEELRPTLSLPIVTGDAHTAIQQLDEIRKARLHLTAEPPPVREPATDNGGFIHAPSLPQGATAAILRNGYLTHRNTTNGQLLAIDLSSERVQTALWFLDGVRQGQPLGTLLGYRFELAMHRQNLDRYIQNFRNAFPLVANKITEHADPGAAIEALAATNVVDGLTLERAWAANQLPPGGDWSQQFPGLSIAVSDQNAIIAILKDLEDVMDALGDLSIAESVYQIVQGNHTRAGGLLDAVSRGEYAPDPQVLRTPRTGLDIHHRLMVLMLGDVARIADWQMQHHPRSTAEPRLDAWLTTLLPKPIEVKSRINYTVPDGHRGVKHETLLLTLADLQVDPLDLLAMSDAAQTAQSSELEQRILYTALDKFPAHASNYQIVFERDPHWQAEDVSFPELLVLARAVRDMVNSARPLVPQDLIEPDRQAEQVGGRVDIPELESRANTALNALMAAIGNLQETVDALRTASSDQAESASDNVRQRLIQVSWFGVHGSIPQSRHGADSETRSQLVVQGDAVLKDLRKRFDEAVAFNFHLPANSAQPADLTILLQKVFDPSFIVLPRFTPPDGQNLKNAFADSQALLTNQKEVLPRWVQQLTHVRPAISRFDKAVSLARIVIGMDNVAQSSQLAELTVGQLPYKKNDRWLGLPFVAGAPLPSSGRISLVAWITGNYNAGLPHCGLLLDDWPERIPNPLATTGLTFHYEEPKARAPQTFLLACNPDSTSTTWNDDLLLAILNETIDLAKIRTVDLDTIQEAGQILPALYFAFNAVQDSISAQFGVLSQ